MREVPAGVEERQGGPGAALVLPEQHALHLRAPELQGLTPVEQSAIQRLFPIMKIYRLSRGGALHLKGHCLTVQQDVQGFAQRLPPAPSELPMVFLIGPGQRVSYRGIFQSTQL